MAQREVSPEQLQRLLKQFPDADANKDGALSKDEARAYWQKMKGKLGGKGKAKAEAGKALPEQAVVARAREWGRELRAAAPAYLQPSAQMLLLETTGDCLAVLERAVNWEAEQLYGVAGLGPFDEF
jgi:hypothetical protein